MPPDKKERLIKSRQRVKDFAEVYTPERIVKDMLDLIPENACQINSTYLEFTDIHGRKQSLDLSSHGNRAFNVDCMEVLKLMPDKCVDLCVVDPPYGLGKKLLNGGNTGIVNFKFQYAEKEWDNERPTQEYFNQLFRVSKNQIIWGANYFIDYLRPSRGIIAWDKEVGDVYNFSHFEMAWTSFDCIARLVKISNKIEKKIHPTQKPVALYRWIFQHYAKPGDKILDTHLGSGSSRIAAYDAGLDFTGYEIDADYFAKQEERFNAHTAQMSLFLED